MNLKDEAIQNILSKMSKELNLQAYEELKNTLYITFNNLRIEKEETALVEYEEDMTAKYIRLFIASKQVKGCSKRTLGQYTYELIRFFLAVGKNVCEVTADDVKVYLAKRATTRKIKRSTQDNERRILSSFYAWLTIEEYIPRNIMLRVDAIKQPRIIRKPFSASDIEKLMNGCKRLRDKAIIQILLSTGARVAELTNLTLSDVDFDRGEAVVYGKGSKERTVYITDKAMYYLREYLNNRNDNNISLFTGAGNRTNSLSIAGVQNMLRTLGNRVGVKDTHPHRFRRTLATNLLTRGTPIEEVKEILGHEKIETTLLYVLINGENVKSSHRKYAA